MKGRTTVFGILIPAGALAGATLFGWCLCKAAGDADRRAEQMEVEADQAWVAQAKARAAESRARAAHPSRANVAGGRSDA